jgi:NAD(P)-dependent dehydrogenase (short-subunit alcohol dehydrogenase family)
MDIAGKDVLVLGGHGLVGGAVCRELLAHGPARLVVASRRRANADAAVAQLRDEAGNAQTLLLPAWGDVFLRADGQEHDGLARSMVVADADRRRTFVSDLLEPLDEEIVGSSMLARLILGTVPGLDGRPAAIVIDCINTATALGYQDLYHSGQHLARLAQADAPGTDWPAEVEHLLTVLALPQLIRHIQILHEALRRAGTRAYVKVGTSGTGGMGFNIPYTHGEERPSRLLLAKAALAGAQTLLTFLMARTPGGPQIVKEIKPTALIGWREISHGPIRRGDRAIALYDCPLERAVPLSDPKSRAPEGDFGVSVNGELEGAYIDTGENGLFTAAEFAAITALGQMAFVTPEEIARDVVREIRGGATGHDVIAGLDATVTGPSYRAAHLRDAALTRLRQLEAQHGEAVAFEILGPPRLSKLLFEAFLLKLRNHGDRASNEPGVAGRRPRR